MGNDYIARESSAVRSIKNLWAIFAAFNWLLVICWKNWFHRHWNRGVHNSFVLLNFSEERNFLSRSPLLGWWVLWTRTRGTHLSSISTVFSLTIFGFYWYWVLRREKWKCKGHYRSNEYYMFEHFWMLIITAIFLQESSLLFNRVS